MSSFAVRLRFMIDFVGYGTRFAAVVDECIGAGGLVACRRVVGAGSAGHTARAGDT
jgi:hypothetical protein